jgi:hypothetical protein
VQGAHEGAQDTPPGDGRSNGPGGPLPKALEIRGGTV